MKKGDIILIPFPFTDLKAIKLRPAVVLAVEKHDQDIIIAGITSQKLVKTIKLTNNDLSKGKLPVDSYIKYNKIATLNKSLIKQVVAKLSSSKKEELLEKVRDLF